MIVYGSSMSPFVRKVLAFAHEKGVEVENKPLPMNSDDAEFLSASPFRKIPALRDGDFTISDSTAIVMYLDAVKPDPNLIPEEPRARAMCFWYDEFADTLLMECGRKLFFHRLVSPMFMGAAGDEGVAAAAEAELPRYLDYLERMVPASGFLLEDRITLADLAVASTFVNLREHLGMAIDAGMYPRTVAYADGILARDSYAGLVAREVRFMDRMRGAAAPAPAGA